MSAVVPRNAIDWPNASWGWPLLAVTFCSVQISGKARIAEPACAGAVAASAAHAIGHSHRVRKTRGGAARCGVFIGVPRRSTGASSRESAEAAARETRFAYRSITGAVVFVDRFIK